MKIWRLKSCSFLWKLPTRGKGRVRWHPRVLFRENWGNLLNEAHWTDRITQQLFTRAINFELKLDVSWGFAVGFGVFFWGGDEIVSFWLIWIWEHSTGWKAISIIILIRLDDFTEIANKYSTICQLTSTSKVWFEIVTCQFSQWFKIENVQSNVYWISQKQRRRMATFPSNHDCNIQIQSKCPKTS